MGLAQHHLIKRGPGARSLTQTFALRWPKTLGYPEEKNNPFRNLILKEETHRKKLEVKEEGRELTLGSKEGRVSGLVSRRTNEWSVESMLGK